MHALTHTGSTLSDMVQGLWNIVTGHSKGDVAGPIGVAQMAGQVAQHGFYQFAVIHCLIEFKSWRNQFIANSRLRWWTFGVVDSGRYYGS